VIKTKKRWEGNVARMGERRGTYRFFAGTPDGKRPLCRPRRGWEDNIRMNHPKEIGWKCFE